MGEVFNPILVGQGKNFKTVIDKNFRDIARILNNITSGEGIPGERFADDAINTAKISVSDKANLIVKVNATNPAYQVDVDADHLKLDDSTRLLEDIDLTIDITVSGANGLDTGSEAGNTWYSIWVIQNPTTKTVAGLFSTSTTAPTLPLGYTKKRRVGWVRNDASSNFFKFHLVADWWYWDVIHTVLSTSSAATSWTDVDCSAYVPPTSQLIILHIRSGDSDDDDTYTNIRRNGTADTGGRIGIDANGIPTTRVEGMGISISCDSSQIMEYKNDSGDEIADIHITGYHDPV